MVRAIFCNLDEIRETNQALLENLHSFRESEVRGCLCVCATGGNPGVSLTGVISSTHYLPLPCAQGEDGLGRAAAMAFVATQAAMSCYIDFVNNQEASMRTLDSLLQACDDRFTGWDGAFAFC